MPSRINSLPLNLLLVCMSVLAFSPHASGASLKLAGEVPFSFDMSNQRIPKWSNGQLLALEGSGSAYPAIRIFNAQGNPVSVTPFSIPGAALIQVADFDRGIDGTIGLVGTASDPQGRFSSFVASISTDGTKQLVTRTSPYSPLLVTVAQDGTLWTQGVERPGTNGTVPGGQAGLTNPAAGAVRHFNASGLMTGSYIRQSTLRNPTAHEYFNLRASRNRIAWYSGENERYVEVSPQGVLITDISVPMPSAHARVTGFAVNDKGDSFISTESTPVVGGKPQLGVWMLDRVSHAWLPVARREADGDASQFSLLYGIDGARLVLSSQDWHRIKFYSLSE